MRAKIDELSFLLQNATIQDLFNIASLLNEHLIISELVYSLYLGKYQCIRDLAKTPLGGDLARHYKVKFFGGPDSIRVFICPLTTYFIDRLLLASSLKSYPRIVKKIAKYLWKEFDSSPVIAVAGKIV
jgi:hypothetical protein